jgi:hypothetical protein
MSWNNNPKEYMQVSFLFIECIEKYVNIYLRIFLYNFDDLILEK